MFTKKKKNKKEKKKKKQNKQKNKTSEELVSFLYFFLSYLCVFQRLQKSLCLNEGRKQGRKKKRINWEYQWMQSSERYIILVELTKPLSSNGYCTPHLCIICAQCTARLTINKRHGRKRNCSRCKREHFLRLYLNTKDRLHSNENELTAQSQTESRKNEPNNSLSLAVLRLTGAR